MICEICDLELKSTQINSHCKGKKHKESLSKEENKGKARNIITTATDWHKAFRSLFRWNKSCTNGNHGNGSSRGKATLKRRIKFIERKE